MNRQYPTCWFFNTFIKGNNLIESVIDNLESIDCFPRLLENILTEYQITPASFLYLSRIIMHAFIKYMESRGE